MRTMTKVPTATSGGPARLGRTGLVMRLSALLLLGAAVTASAGEAVTALAAPGANDEPAQRECLRCHAMTTLAYRDPQTDKIVDLSIAPGPLADSVHGKLGCVECHDASYRRYPHPAEAKNEHLACVDCHEKLKDAQERSYRFKTIAAEFEQSVHATAKKAKEKHIRCHSCHDPHRFRKSERGEPIAAIVQQDNGVCLSCHKKLLDPLRDSHAWLPNRDRHWESVRCLDCHTPLSGDGRPVSHQVLKAEDSNRDCVNCHSKEPRLLSRLYRYRSRTDVEQAGWMSAAVFNEAYVVGMSRSPALDRWGLGLIALTILGLAAHGFGRYKAHQRTKGEQK